MKAFFNESKQQWHFSDDHPGDDFEEVGDDVSPTVQQLIPNCNPQYLTVDRAKNRIMTLKLFSKHDMKRVIPWPG